MSPVTAPNLARSFREWRTHYANRAYALARHEAAEAVDGFPESPEALFMLGLAQLANRELATAGATFGKLRSLLESGPRRASLVDFPHFDRIGAATAAVLEGLAARRLAGAPADPFAWMVDPARILAGSQALDGRVQLPLGRHEALGQSSVITGGVPFAAGVLAGEMTVTPIVRDTFRSLLGKDDRIRIDVDRRPLIDTTIRIIDGPPTASPDAAPPAAAPPAKHADKPAVAPIPHQFKPAVATVAAAGAIAKAVAIAATGTVDPWDEWETRIRDLAGAGKWKDATSAIADAIAQYPQSARLSEFQGELLANHGDHAASARSLADAVAKAVRAGAADREHHALRKMILATANEPALLDELSTRLEFMGVPKHAVELARLAAEGYRAHGDHGKLADVLRRAVRLAPEDSRLRAELDRIEGIAQGLQGLSARLGKPTQMAPPPRA